MPDVELRIPADVQYVGLARLIVTVAARQAGMVSERIEDLKIAVSEAVTNAISAHDRAGVPDPVVLAFGPTDAGSFEVEVADAGPGFTPAQPADPAERDWTQESGLGVTLIRGLTDDVVFLQGEGTLVQMRFAVGLGPELGDVHPTAVDGTLAPR